MKQSQSGEFCWSDLATTDVAAAKEFYKSVLGWKFMDREIEGVNYTMIQKDDKDIGGIWTIPKEKEGERASHWMTYVAVNNVQETLDKAVKNGAQVLRPVMKIEDKGSVAVVIDPTGARIAFWQALKSA